MVADCLSYRDTNSFSSTFLAYLEKDPQMLEFIENWPTLESLYQQISKKQNFSNREVLVKTLKKQYGEFLFSKAALPDSVNQNIELLSDENTFTITTGHQLSLFTGPLYFLYKISSVIRLTRDLKKAYPSYNFVPVFWMATEDHDFAEINHTYYENTEIKWDTPSHSATGRLSTKSIQETVKKYTQILGLQGHSETLKSLVEEAYLKHNNLADATRSLVNGLFGKEGLVILDADDKELKACFAPIIQKDLVEQNSYSQVQLTNLKLHDKGFQTQVFAREINFFYLMDEFRDRIIPNKDGTYEVLNQNVGFTQEQLIHEVQENPERFSPNVIMRPLYQEVVLPNLAYIGGGAEIVYWLQLKGIFDLYNIPFPLLIPRNSALIMEEKKLIQWKKLGFDKADLFKKTDLLLKEFVELNTKHTLNLHKETAEFEKVFTDLKERVSEIETTLISSTAAVEKRLLHALQNLEKKLLKAEKRNHAQGLEIIQAIKDAIYPMGHLQERHQNMAKYFVHLGPDFIQSLIENLDPLDFRFLILCYKKQKV